MTNEDISGLILCIALLSIYILLHVIKKKGE